MFTSALSPHYIFEHIMSHDSLMPHSQSASFDLKYQSRPVTDFHFSKKFQYIMSQTNFACPVEYSSGKTAFVQKACCVVLIKYFSSSAVQKEPTQSPIQSHSTSHSPLLNRLSVNHHWLPSAGWILWSHCEYRALYLQYFSMNILCASLKCFPSFSTQTEPCPSSSLGSLFSCLEFTTYEQLTMHQRATGATPMMTSQTLMTDKHHRFTHSLPVLIHNPNILLISRH